MTTRYAVANGALTSTSTWATTPGGTPGASVPVAGDTADTQGFTVTAPGGVYTTNPGLVVDSVGGGKIAVGNDTWRSPFSLGPGGVIESSGQFEIGDLADVLAGGTMRTTGAGYLVGWGYSRAGVLTVHAGGTVTAGYFGTWYGSAHQFAGNVTITTWDSRQYYVGPSTISLNKGGVLTLGYIVNNGAVPVLVNNGGTLVLLGATFAPPAARARGITTGGQL